jgi:hypothetical protein
MKLQQVITLVFGMALIAGCDQAVVSPQGELKIAPQDDASSSAPAAAADESESEPEPTPSPAASAAPSAPKSIFSAWARTDGHFTVDLTNVQNIATGSGIETNERVLFVFTPSVTCSAIVKFNGTESTGTLEIVDSRSTTGSASANNGYCNPSEGFYYYDAMAGDELRLCKDTGVCQFWE